MNLIRLCEHGATTACWVQWYCHPVEKNLIFSPPSGAANKSEFPLAQLLNLNALQLIICTKRVPAHTCDARVCLIQHVSANM